jgi:1-acyl-sn-glycerol-3-phosphate acyltransferase
MKYLKLPLQFYSIFVIVTAFFIFIFPVSVMALPFNSSRRIKIVSPGWGMFGKILIYLGIMAKVTKIDERDDDIKKQRQPQGLHIANHQSFIDIPLVLTTLQIPPIMKREVLYIPIFGLCGYASGAIIVDRSRKDSRKKVFELAKNRLVAEFKSLQYYPEGTRQRSGFEPKDFSEIKTPLMEFAYDQGIPLYPISLYGTKKVLSHKTGIIRYFQKLGIKNHKPLYPQDFESKEEFLKAGWKKVQDGYYELAEKLN